MGRVLLVRHGQASFGAADYDVLSDVGWEQGRLLGAHLARLGVRPDLLVRGALRRHRETLDAVGEGAGWTLAAEEDARLDEFDHLAVVASHPEFAARGADLDRRSFQALFEEATALWMAGSDPVAGGAGGPVRAGGADAAAGESFLAFRDRVQAALADLAAQAGPGRTVVAVTSGGVIAALASALVLDVDLAASPAPADPVGPVWQRLNAVCVNTGVTSLVVGASGVRLLTFNAHEHLGGATLTYR
ncbi:histidine phosphatase family protein [Nocardioides sp. TRM66260-LWL]|uniref:histidine phosphatase family protein n=1 Tax=Nocardioides sp. TRM66260-LWL TaxID=2874478 RepID=UPI001CC64765|nr:histidine phosphatase family protein [Nocardioides sp. TRM66260-LWL]MBZ5735975.1 histidine phosphatase family protein [Nocardioides sp. TRM66260-LWL]